MPFGEFVGRDEWLRLPLSFLVEADLAGETTEAMMVRMSMVRGVVQRVGSDIQRCGNLSRVQQRGGTLQRRLSYVTDQNWVTHNVTPAAVRRSLPRYDFWRPPYMTARTFSSTHARLSRDQQQQHLQDWPEPDLGHQPRRRYVRRTTADGRLARWPSDAYKAEGFVDPASMLRLGLSLMLVALGLLMIQFKRNKHKEKAKKENKEKDEVTAGSAA